MAQYTNKFILKADTTHLNSELKKLETSYTSAMDKIGVATKDVAAAEKKLELATKDQIRVLKEKEAYTGQHGVTKANKAYKEQIALVNQSVAIAKKELSSIKAKNSALKTNSQNIKAHISAIKEEIATKKALLATDKKSISSVRGLITARKRQRSATAAATEAEKRYIITKRTSSQAEKAYAFSLAQSSNNLVRHIRHLESYLVAIYAVKKGYDFTLGRGHEFNKLIETETIGLKLLIAQNLQDVDSKGKRISALDKFTLSQTEANKAIKIARDVNLETPHNFAQTIQIYKSLTGQVLNLGGSLKDTGDLTKRLSILASASGIEFQSFLKTVDTVLTGEGKQSQLTLALGRFGITNDLIKEAAKTGGILELFEEKLQGVDVAGAALATSWDGAANKFLNVWDEMFAKAQEPIFEKVKDEMVDWSLYFKEHGDEVVDTFHGIYETVTALVPILKEAAKALLFWKIGTAIFTKASKAVRTFNFALARTEVLARQSGGMFTAAEVRSTKLRNSVTKLGVSLKGLAVANAPMLILLAAYETWNYLTSKQTELQDQVNESLKHTALSMDAIHNLTVAQQKSRIIGIQEELADRSKITKQLMDVAYATKYNNGEGSKEHIQAQAILDTHIAKLRELQKQVTTIQSVVNGTDDVATALYKSGQGAADLTEELSKAAKAAYGLKSALIEGMLVRGDISNIAAIKKEHIAKVQSLKAEKSGTELQTALIQEQNRYVKESRAAHEDMAKERKDAAKSLNSLTVSNLKAHGKEKEALELKIKMINDEEIPASEKLLKIDTLREEFANRKSKGDSKLKKQVKDADDLYRKYLEITGQENLLEAFELDKTVDGFRKAGYEASKLLEIQEALANNDKREFDSNFKLEAPTIVEEVFNPYLNLIESQKEYILNIKKAGKDQYKIDKINTKQTSLRLKGYAGLANGMKGFFKEGSKGYKALNATQKVLQAFEFAWFVKKQLLEATSIGTRLTNVALDTTATVASEGVKGTALGVNAVLAQGQGDPYTAWARMGAMAAVVAGLGVAIGGVGGGSVSEADIEAAKGRTEFDDNSFKNAAELFADAQYPMLEVTNKMYKHLRNMDANFYSVARALNTEASSGGVDLTGVNFVDTFSEGFAGFSSKSVSLISTGLSFELNNLNDLMNAATVGVRGYTTTLVEESSWWGLSSDTSIKKAFKDLPPEVVSDIADSFADGYEAILTAGTTLGLDAANLEAALRASELDIGDIDFTGLSPSEVSDRLSQVFSTSFSGVIDGIAAFSGLVERYAKGTEYGLETLIRISTEYDQASHSFDLIGKAFTDSFMDVTRTWTEETVVQTGGIFSGWWGGFTSNFTSVLTESTSTIWGGALNWMSRFRGTTETITQTFTETTQQLYTAQMQILDIVESTGGMTEFQDAMGAYMSGFYTETEQLGFITKSMEKSFATLGLEMPKTNDEFRSLLENMNTGTKEGAYLYGQVLLLADGFNSMTDASDSLLDSVGDIEDAIRSIADAWLGNLSYLTIAQKAEYASGYFDIVNQSEGQLNSLDAARAMAETALKATATKEEYIPVFDRYIKTLEEQAPAATTDDVVAELRALRAEVQILEETTRRTA